MYIIGAPIFFEKKRITTGKTQLFKMRGGNTLKKNVKRRYIHGNDSFDGFGKRYKKKQLRN
jgi:hypothetical protein